MQLFWLFYFVMMNFASLYLMYSDKQKAIQKTWRIPEITLLSFVYWVGQSAPTVV